MKYAYVDGQRQEAQSGLSGECPGCEGTMIARCGEVRVPHWAHRSQRQCDVWWENETEWHQRWKNEFPDECQEVVDHAEDGERHIADVKTSDGWVIEFQHSYIIPGERRSRDEFYEKLVWVVDGTRRKRDRAQFLSTFDESLPIAKDSRVRKVPLVEGALLRDWAGSIAHVFFDFGDEHDLYWVLPVRHDFWAYVFPITRTKFLELHRPAATEEDRGFDWAEKLVVAHIVSPQRVVATPTPPPRRQTPGRNPLRPTRGSRMIPIDALLLLQELKKQSQTRKKQPQPRKRKPQARGKRSPVRRGKRR